MASLIQKLWHRITGRPTNDTHTDEIAKPTTTSQANGNSFSIWDRIWYGLFARFVTPRIPERIEDKEQENMKTDKQRLNRKSPTEELLSKTKEQNEPNSLADDVTHLPCEPERERNASGESTNSSQNNGNRTDDSNDKFHTTKVLKMAAFFEEMAVNSNRTSTTSKHSGANDIKTKVHEKEQKQQSANTERLILTSDSMISPMTS